jgi:hypothetical protein
MDSGPAFNPVPTILLDDRVPVTGLVLLDYGRLVPIAVPVQIAMVFAYPGADRPGANADSSAIAGTARALTAATTNRYFFMVFSFCTERYWPN